MRNRWLWLLAAALPACRGQVDIAADVALKHQLDAARLQQLQLLHASRLRVAAVAAGTGPAVLQLEVLLPRDQPQRPDTLKQRVRKLAHLLVADLARPAAYQVLNVQVTERKSYFDAGATSQAFIYPVAGLR